MKLSGSTLVACVFLCCYSTAQVVYNYKPFQNPGATVTRAFGLNGHAEVVGLDDAMPGRHAFLVNHGPTFHWIRPVYWERTTASPAASITQETSWALTSETMVTNTASFCGRAS